MLDRNILLFIKVPPPITGATLMNEYVRDSILLHKNYNIRCITISGSKELRKSGSLSIKKLNSLLKYSFKLFWMLYKFKPGIVYFQLSPIRTAFIRDLIYILIIKISRKQIVFHLHGKGISTESRNPIKKVLYTYAFHNSKVICLSEKLQNDIEDVYKGLPYIVNNGIKVNNDLFKLYNNNNEPIKLLFLSNLIYSKGILIFLDALEILINDGIIFSGYIIGEEVDLDKITLLSIIKNKHLENYVSYMGARYGSDKYNLIKCSDVLVFPTYEDVWGLVILEAMEAGLPVIASDEGAISDMVDDGLTGFLVEKKNPQQIADKIKIIAQNLELIKIMGEAGRKKFMQRFTLETFEQNIAWVFEDILNK